MRNRTQIQNTPLFFLLYPIRLGLITL